MLSMDSNESWIVGIAQEETAAMRAEVQELRSHARIFQLSKCTACTSALDLPAVHFLCMHSFHQRCLGDNEKECPVCAPANRHVLDMKRSLEANVNDHDTFFQLLRNSDDGFSVIAEYFGRGILNKPAQPRGGAATSLSRGNSLRTWLLSLVHFTVIFAFFSVYFHVGSSQGILDLFLVVGCLNVLIDSSDKRACCVVSKVPSVWPQKSITWKSSRSSRSDSCFLSQYQLESRILQSNLMHITIGSM